MAEVLTAAVDEEEISAQQAQNMMDSFSAYNLDEVVPETITVSLREFVADKNSYHIEVTQHEIRTFVPMFLFNRMQANQRKVAKQRKTWLALAKERDAKETASEEEPLFEEDASDFLAMIDREFTRMLAESDPSFVWQAKEILSVWRMTPGEEGMSLKKLLLGLDFEQIEALFMRFFVEKIRRKLSKA